MKIYEAINKKYIQPIPKYNEELDGWENINIQENNEKLISLKNIDKKIIVKPQYFINNVKGAENDCKVRETIAKKLILIANKLPKGFKLLIWDSYRTLQTQQTLFDSYYNDFKRDTKFSENQLIEYTKKFVSLPSDKKDRPSPHNTGAAVDATICDCNEIPIDLGTYFDDFKPIAYTRFYEEKLEQGISLTEEEKEILLNRRVLCNLFHEEGFINYPYEIWHKSFGDQMCCKLLKSNFAIYGGIDSK